ncbi:MAG TPA: hypothetical protein VH157_07025 [Bryobacteraceae bacterium]|jgi:hypothetical protein|nr:hypothetical protein [Bryobacteraceae bacterium]
MAPRQADLQLYQGDDWAATVTVLNQDMTPANITGYTAQSQIRRNVADQDPIVAAELQATVQAPNSVLLFLSHAQTSLLSGQYQWDLQLTSPANDIVTILAGAVNVTQEVTRETSALAAQTQVLDGRQPVYSHPPSR